MIADISISIGPVALILGFITIYLKFYSKKPHIFLNDTDNIVIHNITGNDIIILYICSKEGIVRDNSYMSALVEDKNSTFGSDIIYLNLPIKQGESEYLLYTLNKTYNYDVSIKRKSYMHPNIYFIELYSKNKI